MYKYILGASVAFVGMVALAAANEPKDSPAVKRAATTATAVPTVLDCKVTVPSVSPELPSETDCRPAGTPEPGTPAEPGAGRRK